MVYDNRQLLFESTLDQVAQCMVGEASSAYEHYNLKPCQYVDLHDSGKRHGLLCSQFRAFWEVGKVETSLWLRRRRHSVSLQGACLLVVLALKPRCVSKRQKGEKKEKYSRMDGRPFVSRICTCILSSLGKHAGVDDVGYII